MAEQKSLAAKMAAIMGDVPTMIKNGNNVQQKYQYVTAEDVKVALRPLLKKHKVAFFAQMIDAQRETSINKNGTPMVTVVAKMRYTFVDGETGESMECDWYGEANDYADKAVNKAATAATKYFLINTFLLSTTEPESDEETIEAPQPATQRITKKQLAAVASLAKARWGGDYKTEGAEVVGQMYGCELAELTEAQADELIDILRRTEVEAAVA